MNNKGKRFLIINYILILFIDLVAIQLCLEDVVFANFNKIYTNSVAFHVFSKIEPINEIDATYIIEILNKNRNINPQIFIYLSYGNVIERREVTVDMSSSTSHGVVLGKDVYKLGDTINLLGEKYEVSEILCDEFVRGFDTRCIVAYENLTDYSKSNFIYELSNAINQYGVDIRFSSYEDMDKSIDDFLSDIESIANYYIVESSRNQNYQTWLYIHLLRFCIVCLSVYSLVILCSIINIYIFWRNKEIKIRQWLGCGYKYLLNMLLKEYLSFIAEALIPSIILFIIYNIITGQDNITILLKIILLGCVLICTFVILFSLAVSLIVLARLDRIQLN